MTSHPHVKRCFMGLHAFGKWIKEGRNVSIRICKICGQRQIRNK